MDISTMTAGRGLTLGRSKRVLVATVATAFALVLAWFVLVQQPAEAQLIDVRQFACATLISIRNAFASSPFFSFVTAALDPIIAAFGCGVS